MENTKMTKEEFILKHGNDLHETLEKGKPQSELQTQKMLNGKMLMIAEQALSEGIKLTTQEILEIAQQDTKKEFEIFISVAFEIYSPEWIAKKKAEKAEIEAKVKATKEIQEKAKLEAEEKKEEEAK